MAKLPLRKLYARWKPNWASGRQGIPMRAEAYAAILAGDATPTDDAVA